MSLRARMLGLFFGLGVLPLLTLGVVSYRQSMDAVEELLATETAFIALRTAGELESRYARYQSDLAAPRWEPRDSEPLPLPLRKRRWIRRRGAGEQKFLPGPGLGPVPGLIPLDRTAGYERGRRIQARRDWRRPDLRMPSSLRRVQEGFRFTHPIEDPTTSGDLGRGRCRGLYPSGSSFRRIVADLRSLWLQRRSRPPGRPSAFTILGGPYFRPELPTSSAPTDGRWTRERLAQESGSFVFTAERFDPGRIIRHNGDAGSGPSFPRRRWRSFRAPSLA